MSRFYLTDREMEALAGLRHGAWALYVVLRRRMNFTSGEVGRKPLISRFALREALFVEPCRGRAAVDSGTPSEKAMRGFEAELERAGLIVYRSIAEQRQLIFFLPLAELAQSRSGEVGQVWEQLGQTQLGQRQSQINQGFEEELGQEVGQIKNSELGQSSGYGDTEKTLNHSVESSSLSLPVVVREGVAADRAVEVAKLLIAGGLSPARVNAARLRASDVVHLLGRSDADWLAALATSKAAKPNQDVPINYLLKVLASVSASPLVAAERGKTRSAKGVGGRFDPRSALAKLEGVQEVDDGDWIDGSAKRVD